MKIAMYVKALRIAIIILTTPPLIGAIIFSTITNYDSSKFPLILLVNFIVLIPLALILYFGNRSLIDLSDKKAQMKLLLATAIVILFPGFVIFRFLQEPLQFSDFIGLVFLSFVMVIVWSLNVLQYLFNQGRSASSKNNF